MNFKVKTPRDAKFLVWVRALPCAVCGQTPAGDAHHTETGGMGMTGSDYSTVPLCRKCHTIMHSQYGKSGFWEEEELSSLLGRIRAAYELKHGRRE